jgi:glycosyltransferase involved in cell wall biosynthesis
MKTVDPVFAATSRPFSATAVIVLYRLAINESPAFRSVMDAREMLNPRIGTVNVLLWDNSPTPQWQLSLREGVQYVSDPRNSGLAQAYNRALESAIEQRSDWLITLDQDTAIPLDYFLKMASAADAATQYAGVGAIVPQIEAEGKIVSPNHFVFGAIPRWYPRGYCGVPRQPVFAFNSASMLSVAALLQVGGYDPWFWLDNSDAQIFSRLHQHGKRVFIAGNTLVRHEFSMKNLTQRMSAERYRNVLLAESAFWDTRMNRLAGCERTLRLILRLIKHRLRKDSPELQSITRWAIRRRLFNSKELRIREWKTLTRLRLGDTIESSGFHTPRQKVSACMAAFNGARFIDAQLNSILPQLHPQDEIVIVDDCSRDDTVARIAGYHDQRVRLLRHTRNSGVVATFEDALRSATGEILFLCDDDDIWAPTKVRSFLDVFKSRPKVELVTSRVRMIDENGTQLPNSRVNRMGRFLPGFWQNVFKNHFQGSAMAIRASLLGRVLPFPGHKSIQHDAWIGTRIELAGGETAFIDEDLLFYRRHAHNTERFKNRLDQLRTRIELLMAHVSYALRLTTK